MTNLTCRSLACAALLALALAYKPATAAPCRIVTQSPSACITLRSGPATATSCNASILAPGSVRIGNGTTIVQNGRSDGVHVTVVSPGGTVAQQGTTTCP